MAVHGKRDIDADYKAARLTEYENLVRAGRDEDAKKLAKLLKDTHGVTVKQAETEKTEKVEAKQDTPEKAVPEKAGRRHDVKPSAKG